MTVDIHHPNPILRPTAETRCPVCGAAAAHWEPDYDRGEFLAAYDCECHYTTPRAVYVPLVRKLDHVFKTRVKMWRRLGRDERAMAAREYGLTSENQAIVAGMLALGARQQVFLHGEGGVGKTHLAILAGVALLNRGFTVEYWPELDFFEDAQRYVMSDSDTKVKPGREGDVLILDDLGKTRPGPYAAQMLFDVLQFRVKNGLGLIVTSNHSPEEAADRMVLDQGNANAVLSRLRAGDVLTLLGEDRREGARA